MKRIETTIEIEARPEAVWSVLTDLGDYADWNPQTIRASGRVAVGETVSLRVDPSGSRVRDLSATVTTADPPRRLEWVAKLPIPGLFAARHRFELTPLADGRSRLENVETLSGLLVRLGVARSAAADYEAMNRALKRRVEGERSDGGTARDASTAI